MFAIQRITTQSPRLLKLSQEQRRTLLCTPPRVRTPFAEKVAMGIILYVGIMAIPAYISYNIRHYVAHKSE